MAQLGLPDRGDDDDRDVMELAIDLDAGYGRQYRDDEMEPAVDRAMWWPEYVPYVPG